MTDWVVKSKSLGLEIRSKEDLDAFMMVFFQKFYGGFSESIKTDIMKGLPLTFEQTDVSMGNIVKNVEELFLIGIALTDWLEANSESPLTYYVSCKLFVVLDLLTDLTLAVLGYVKRNSYVSGNGFNQTWMNAAMVALDFANWQDQIDRGIRIARLELSKELNDKK